jgi:hypothetical protein
MRYFGEKSLSSWMNPILQTAWVLVLVSALGLSVLLGLAMFPTPLSHTCLATVSESIRLSGANDPEWNEFLALPALTRVVVFPYLALLTVLMLLILRKARALFANFARDAIFRQENVALIGNTSKLLIAFSLFSFNFAALLVSLVLLVVGEILRNGTTLQDEQDLTV